MPLSRVLVIGLDCAAPRFVFGPEAFELPTLRNLMSRGCFGTLKSCHPPITIPAWTCMLSGKDPGALGVYGFHLREGRAYTRQRIATSDTIREKRIWDRLADAGKRTALVGVPQTYPPTPINGWLVSGLLTPGPEAEFTYPPALKSEILRETGAYLIDVTDFRTPDKRRLLKQIYALMENRFDVARYVLRSKPWDFFMMVEMGMDRLHHGFWQYADPAHPRFEPGNPYQNVLSEYYEAVDTQIGRLLEDVGEDTAVLVVSDHGARALHGGFRINEWLIQMGHLRLRTAPKGTQPLDACDVDWPKTRAWATGGYCARIHINLRGREEQGAVSQAEYADFRESLIQQIEAIEGPGGTRLGNQALIPENLYETTRGTPPDLIVYLGGLDWRALGAVGALGPGGLFQSENDTGPDGANHDPEGIFILADPRSQGAHEVVGTDLLDVTPTILDLFGLDAAPDLRGSSRAVVV